MKKLPMVSIIIPLYVICDRFFQDLTRFKNLSYPNYEILVVSDRKVKVNDPQVRLILTGVEQTGPAEKRDLAIQHAKGEIIAFIDDDAYPDRNWLKNAIINFLDPHVAAVGGPGVTPPEDNRWEQLTGLTYESFFCGGFARYRFLPQPAKLVKDYPAYNLLVRKKVLLEVGGYGNTFYGGEDTFLCLKIVNKGWLIKYDPKVVIYHHRRPLFISYLKQISNVGVHRGYFAREFPQTSRTFIYFLPTILTGGFFLLPFLNTYLFLELTAIFLFLGWLSIINKTNPFNAILVSIAVILTHLTYGTSFVKGFFTPQLKN